MLLLMLERISRTVDTNLKIDYTIVRGIRIRTGTLLIANTSAGSTISDEFVEDSDVGVTFSLDRSKRCNPSYNISY